jgi:multiple sugar transport system substrate-binding protein
VIPTYVQGEQLDLAKQFLLDHTAQYESVMLESELYDFPCRPGVLPEGQIEEWLANDPYMSNPPNKLEVLLGAADWGVHLGYPGVANPAISAVFGQQLIVNMFGAVVRGEMTPEEAAASTAEQVEAIFQEWRDRGLVGGGD